MLNRREFLQSAIAGGVALAAVPLFGEEKKVDINATFANIASRLIDRKLVDSVTDRFVENPEVGLVQWPWAHYRHGISRLLLPHIEIVNRELFAAMDETHDIPDASLDELIQEGFLEGSVKKQIQDYKNVHRQLVRNRLTRSIPGGGVHGIAPSEATIDKRLLEKDIIENPVSQVINLNGESKLLSLSPLARLGAGFMMHQTRGTRLLAAEDPVIDAKAEKAESSYDQKEFTKWIFTERDKYFVKVIQESRRRIAHIIVGYDHDLTDDIAAANAEGARISHLVLSVPGIRKMKEYVAKLQKNTF